MEFVNQPVPPDFVESLFVIVEGRDEAVARVFGVDLVGGILYKF